MTLEFAMARDDAELAVIAELASEIWYEYYVPIIGKAQVDYMVPRFQSVPAMREQIASGYDYFTMHQAGAPLGYVALRPEPELGRMLISKLYLHRNARGRGTGRAAMEFIESRARQHGLALLWLTVNKGNPAVQIYERLGFRNAEAIRIDIGNGFVMDDFRMEKLLT